jgi:hypothetical protein
MVSATVTPSPTAPWPLLLLPLVGPVGKASVPCGAGLSEA